MRRISCDGCGKEMERWPFWFVKPNWRDSTDNRSVEVGLYFNMRDKPDFCADCTVEMMRQVVTRHTKGT